MIDEIIGLINNGFDGLHVDEMILGIAQRVYRRNADDGIDFMPGIINDGEDEAIYVGVDDIKSIIIYHKINAATLANAQRNKGFGDVIHNSDTIQCSVIVLWDTRKIKLHASDMALLIRSRMPQQIIDISGINQATISSIGAILNTKQVFDSEYAFDSAYVLPNYINLIQVNYNIQLIYDQSCISKCINCS